MRTAEQLLDSQTVVQIGGVGIRAYREPTAAGSVTGWGSYLTVLFAALAAAS